MTLREHVLSYLSGKSTILEPLHALRGISFDVHRGEFFSIIGKNGSGKSTLLKIMAGIYGADSGEVRLNGTVSPFLELGVGFNPDLTGKENVFLSAAVLGLRRREIEALYDEIIGFSELERFQDQALKNYSSGMKVRLAFSVAFMVDADILLIDEVLAVGDASFCEKCYDVFRRLKGEGKTIIFVSHGMGNVSEFSDRVMLLHEGRIVSIGEPDKVIHDYQLLTAYEDEKRMAFEESLSQQRRVNGKKEFIPTGDERRWGSGGVRVKDVVSLDSEGREKHVFATGERVRMKITFDVKDPGLETLVVGVSIHRSDDVNALVTYSGPITLKGWKGINERAVELVFPKLELFAAMYYFDVTLLSKYGEKEPYDFLKRCCKLRVYQDNDSPYARLMGISCMKHEWHTEGY